MRRLLARGIMIIVWLPLAALAFGFLGAVHPLGDSFAVFRQPIAGIVAVLGVLLLLLGARWRGGAVLAVAVAAFVTTLPRATPAPSGGQVVRVYQKNLLSLLTNPRKLVADIRGSGADIVTLEEVTSHNKHLIDALKDLYPSQTYCPGRLSGGQAVLSKYPAVGPTIPCEDSRDAAGMLVDTGRFRIWAVAIHLPWPWPYGQAEQVDAVDKLLGTLTQPIVLGGDFNMVPWANSVARIERAGSMVLAGDAGPSFKLPDLPLSIPIDHVLMPEGSRAAHSELRPAFGSDHLGVLSRFELP